MRACRALAILVLLGLWALGCEDRQPFVDVGARQAQFALELEDLNQLRAQEKWSDDEYAARSEALLRKHLDALLELAAAEESVPAIFAGVTTAERDLYLGARGVRKLGAEAEVTVDDLVHTGSNTKAMTATLIGVLIDKGLLNWDSTPEQVLGMAEPSRKGDTVTLAHLLTHTAGVPPFKNFMKWEKAPKFEGDTRAKRLGFARWVLNKRKASGKFKYSNAGYAVAAAMAERVTGKTWEDLMAEHVFAPLEIHATIGWPAKHDRDQPWGHSDKRGFAEEGSPRGAVRPHPPADHWFDLHMPNRPAGDVSMSIVDYNRFLREHLRGLEGRSSLMTKGAFEFLHTAAAGTNSACGWGVNTNRATGLAVHGHAGSAGTFYMVAGLFPEGDFAVAVVVNAGAAESSAVCKELIQAIIAIYWQWREHTTTAPPAAAVPAKD